MSDDPIDFAQQRIKKLIASNASLKDELTNLLTILQSHRATTELLLNFFLKCLDITTLEELITHLDDLLRGYLGAHAWQIHYATTSLDVQSTQKISYLSTQSVKRFLGLSFSSELVTLQDFNALSIKWLFNKSVEVTTIKIIPIKNIPSNGFLVVGFSAENLSFDLVQVAQSLNNILSVLLARYLK